ncbi:MAG: TlpA family protein disulfide reductase [Candidatus Marinimicrobia bacterium]|nr:TlpA family protein disulfide reductase [Candidatus Neomarinimicrobiota bacterium]
MFKILNSISGFAHWAPRVALGSVFLILFLISNFLFSQTNQLPNLSIRMMDGKKTTVDNLLQDGPILIDFWALWCAPCLKAMRHLDEFQSKYVDKGFNVLMINLDTERSRSKVRSYIKSRGYQFLVAMDPSQDTYRRLNGNVLPYTLLVDASGKIVYKHSGYVPGDEKSLEKEILILLDNSSSIVSPSSN